MAKSKLQAADEIIDQLAAILHRDHPALDLAGTVGRVRGKWECFIPDALVVKIRDWHKGDADGE